jgi:hypothetical protein
MGRVGLNEEERKTTLNRFWSGEDAEERLKQTFEGAR